MYFKTPCSFDDIFGGDLPKIVQSHIQFTPPYLSSPVVLCSCHVGMHPRVTTGRAGSGAGKGWSSAGRPRGALHRRTAWNSQAWKLSKQKEHKQRYITLKSSGCVCVCVIAVNTCRIWMQTEYVLNVVKRVKKMKKHHCDLMKSTDVIYVWLDRR